MNAENRPCKDEGGTIEKEWTSEAEKEGGEGKKGVWVWRKASGGRRASRQPVEMERLLSTTIQGKEAVRICRQDKLADGNGG